MTRSMSLIAVVELMLSTVCGVVRGGPLVREVKSSSAPFSQVITRGGDKRISLILDREEYGPLDVTSFCIIRLRPTSVTIAKTLGWH